MNISNTKSNKYLRYFTIFLITLLVIQIVYFTIVIYKAIIPLSFFMPIAADEHREFYISLRKGDYLLECQNMNFESIAGNNTLKVFCTVNNSKYEYTTFPCLLSLEEKSDLQINVENISTSKETVLISISPE